MDTKSKTLLNLQHRLKFAKILDQVYFTVQDWQSNNASVLDKIEKTWNNQKLIVRSSSLTEDNQDQSYAGHFQSVLHVQGKSAIHNAIKQVIHSFGQESHPKNEIFVQPMLENVQLSGVVFTRDTNTNAPYIKINYDDQTGRTDTITSGIDSDSKVFYIHRLCPHKFQDFRDNLIALCFELENLLHVSPLDIEFAIDQHDNLYVFQVRQLLIPVTFNMDDQQHYDSIMLIRNRLKSWMQPHPYLLGSKGIYGVMSDWNPAEIVGIKPKSLALSLYREVVTNSAWAYQRDNYGYRGLRSFPLLVELQGLPYIDVRISFNSFVPKKLDSKIADKLVNAYLDTLRHHTHYHDKIEFNIVFSCFVFDTHKRLQALKKQEFTKPEIQAIEDSLKKLTNNIVFGDNNLWQQDLKRIQKLEDRYNIIVYSNLDDIEKIYWLIEDCKRYGTLPFAGLARAGFIAVEFLKSLVSVKILTQEEYHSFLASLNTISTTIVNDFQDLSASKFLKKYGHLRPGTYDILSKTYDEDPDHYFTWDPLNTSSTQPKQDFKISVQQLNQIDEHLKTVGFHGNAVTLLNFIKEAIEAREYSKFVFTKNISKVLKIYTHLCDSLGISKEDAAFTSISALMNLNSMTLNVKDTLTHSIASRKHLYHLTQNIILPPIITHWEDVLYFYEEKSSPNYITQKSVKGEIVVLDHHTSSAHIVGKIVFIENADPGFDWIFEHKIIGLVTKYGGANSHMAIRSSEFNLPSIIGAGSLYDKLKIFTWLKIDCLNKKVEHANFQF